MKSKHFLACMMCITILSCGCAQSSNNAICTIGSQEYSLADMDSIIDPIKSDIVHAFYEQEIYKAIAKDKKISYKDNNELAQKLIATYSYDPTDEEIKEYLLANVDDLATFTIVIKTFKDSEEASNYDTKKLATEPESDTLQIIKDSSIYPYLTSFEGVPHEVGSVSRVFKTGDTYSIAYIADRNFNNEQAAIGLINKKISEQLQADVDAKKKELPLKVLVSQEDENKPTEGYTEGNFADAHSGALDETPSTELSPNQGVEPGSVNNNTSNK